jgi:hypothetical protein
MSDRQLFAHCLRLESGQRVFTNVPVNAYDAAAVLKAVPGTHVVNFWEADSNSPPTGELVNKAPAPSETVYIVERMIEDEAAADNFELPRLKEEAHNLLQMPAVQAGHEVVAFSSALKTFVMIHTGAHYRAVDATGKTLWPTDYNQRFASAKQAFAQALQKTSPSLAVPEVEIVRLWHTTEGKPIFRASVAGTDHRLSMPLCHAFAAIAEIPIFSRDDKIDIPAGFPVVNGSTYCTHELGIRTNFDFVPKLP